MGLPAWTSSFRLCAFLPFFLFQQTYGLGVNLIGGCFGEKKLVVSNCVSGVMDPLRQRIK